MDLGEIKVRIGADVAGLHSGIAQAQSRVQAMSGRMKAVGAGMQSVGRSMSLAVTLPILAMGKLGLDELKDIQAANAQTAAAIRNVGRGSLITAGHVRQQAGALQLLSGMDDQAIQGAQNLLLRFANLNVKTKEGADAFDRAAKLAVNMGVSMGGPEAAAKALGKGLADPENAMTRLGKAAGLTKPQMATMKKEMDGVHSQAAKQAILMGALEQKYNGAAAAAGTTLGAKLAILQDRVAGVAAQLLEKMIPAVDVMVGWASRLLAFVEQLGPAHQKWAAMLAVAAAAAGPLLIVTGSLVSSIGSLAPVFAALTGPVGLAIVASIAAGVAFVALWRKSEQFKSGVTNAFNGMRAGVTSVLANLRATISQWVVWGTAIWRKYGDEILAVVRPAFNIVKAVVSSFLGNLKSLFNIFLSVLRGDWSGAWNEIKAIVQRTLAAVKTIVASNIHLIGAALKGIVTVVGDLAGRMLAAGKAVGNAIIDGVVAGISAGIDRVVAAAAKLGDAIPGPVKKVLRIASPSRVTFELGKAVAEGMAKGIQAKTPAARKAAAQLAKEVTAILEKASQRFGFRDARLDLESALAGDDNAGVKKRQIDSNAARYAQLAADLNREGITTEQRTQALSEMAAIARENRSLAEEIAEIQTRAEASRVEGMSTSGEDEAGTAAATAAKESATAALMAKIAAIISAMAPALAMPKFARGGVTSGPSIAGEAGAEAVIPLGGGSQNRADRARAMREAGLVGSGLNQTLIFNGADVDMFAAAQLARFHMLSAGLAS